MAADYNIAASVRATLAGAGTVREVKMFGGIGFMLNGNMLSRALAYAALGAALSWSFSSRGRQLRLGQGELDDPASHILGNAVPHSARPWPAILECFNAAGEESIIPAVECGAGDNRASPACGAPASGIARRSG